MVTIKDVAREAGVAISTVSNVINQVDNVSDRTKQRVLDAIEKLKYVPNFNARSLKSNKKNTVGLFLSSIQGDYYRQLLQAVHLQCKMAGYMLNIYVSNENTSEEIYGMILSSGVEGAIIMNESLSDDYIERIARTHMPMVFIDRKQSGEHISSVTVDNYSGAFMGVEYLVKQGHRRIGYIHGIESIDDSERFRGYLEVLEKYNLPVEEDLILNGFFEEVVAYGEIRQLFAKGVVLPDAFFCANDEMAWGCIRALQSAGVTVPEQVSVIGFDNSMLAEHYHPALTTIGNPVTEMGTKSALELFRMMRKEGEPEGREVCLTPSLIVRDTCMVKL